MGARLEGLLKGVVSGRRELAAMIDATLLSPTASLDEARRLIGDVASRGFYCALMPPYHARILAGEAGDAGVRLCSVAGFPYGYQHYRVKAAEVEDLSSHGVVEVDAVINVAAVLSGQWGYVEEEIGALVDAARRGGARLKLIVEAPLLGDSELERIAAIARRVGVDYLKTSTGVLSKGGDPYTVSRLVRLSGGIPVKAAGGIRTGLDALVAIAAGASRIGTSSYLRVIETLPVEG